MEYRSSSTKTKQKNTKSLQTTSLCHSIDKSTSQDLVTVFRVEKTKREKFVFVHLSFFLFIMHNSNTIRCIRILYTLLFWSGAMCRLRLVSYGHKTVFQHATCSRLDTSLPSGHAINSQATPRLLSMCVLQAATCLLATVRGLTIIFSIYLVYLNTV